MAVEQVAEGVEFADSPFGGGGQVGLDDRRRQRVTDAALRLFLERGYVATTIEAIAAEAAVAPATVYQAFGTKQAILARVLDVTIAGDAGPAALLDRDWVKQASRHPDPRYRLALVIRHASQVAARTAPLRR